MDFLYFKFLFCCNYEFEVIFMGYNVFYEIQSHYISYIPAHGGRNINDPKYNVKKKNVIYFYNQSAKH